MNKIALSIILLITFLFQACSQDEVRVRLSTDHIPNEHFPQFLKRSSHLCTQLNQQGIKCTVKVLKDNSRPVEIKMWNQGESQVIQEFGDESQLISDVQKFFNAQ